MDECKKTTLKYNRIPHPCHASNPFLLFLLAEFPQLRDCRPLTGGLCSVDSIALSSRNPVWTDGPNSSVMCG